MDPHASRPGDPAAGRGDEPGGPSYAGPEVELCFTPPEHEGELGGFGRYRVLRKLGQGGMGAVFLGYDAVLEREVTLKILHARHTTKPEARQHFLHEARSAAKVKSDHVVTIYDVGEELGLPFIAMEFLHGSPLDKYLRLKGELSLSHALRVARETATGLAAAHAIGLVHGDIKPANLWLEAPKGRVKLLDFGLARIVDEGHPIDNGMVMGTPAFMSPEQARRQHVDHRSDLFSLGVLLYRLCTGIIPFSGDSTLAVLMSLTRDTPTPVRQINPQLPEALEVIISRLLQKNPADRFQSAEEVAEVIQVIEPAKGTTGLLQVVSLSALAAASEEAGQAAQAEKGGGGPAPKDVLKESPRTGGRAESKTVRMTPASTKLLSVKSARMARASGPRRRFPRWLLALAVGLLLLAAGGVAAFFLLRPPPGTLLVESDEADVEIIIRKDGEVVRERTRDRRFTLRSGVYLVELANSKPGMKLDRDVVVITENGESRLRVQRAVKQAPGKVTPLPADLIVPMTAARPASVFALDYLDAAKHVPADEKFSWQPPDLVAVLGSSRQRHWQAVGALSVSPDGAAVLAGRDSTSQAFQIATGKPLEWPPLAAFSPNGKRGASGNKVYDLANPTQPPTECPFPESIRAFLTGDTVLADGKDGWVVRKLGPQADPLTKFPAVASFALSPNRKYLALAFKDNPSCHVYDVTAEGPKEKFALPDGEGQVQANNGSGQCVSLSSTGRLATIDPAGVLRLWDVSGAKPQLQQALDQKGPARIVQLFPQGDRVVRAAELGFEIWSLGGGKPGKLAGIDGFSGRDQLLSLALTPDGQTIVTGHRSGAVRFWGSGNGAIFERNPLAPQPMVDERADLSPDGRFAALPHEDGRMHLWNLTSLTARALNGTRLSPARFSPDGGALCVGREAGSSGLRLLSPSQPELPPQDFGDGFSPGDYTPDGKWLSAWSATHLAIWDTPASPPKERFDRLSGLNASRWQFTPDGRYLLGVASGSGGGVKVWAMTIHGPAVRYENTIPCLSFELSPDGRTAVFCQANAGVASYDFRDGILELRRLDRIPAAWAHFSPDGRLLLVGGGAAGLKLLEAESGKVLHEWKLRGQPVGGRFHPDGKHAFVTNADHTTYILRPPADVLTPKK